MFLFFSLQPEGRADTRNKQKTKGEAYNVIFTRLHCALVRSFVTQEKQLMNVTLYASFYMNYSKFIRYDFGVKTAIVLSSPTTAKSYNWLNISSGDRKKLFLDLMFCQDS